MSTHDRVSRQKDDAADLHSVQETLRGDPNAFRSIVDRYTPVVFSLAFRYLGSSEDAEDATQEIFARIYAALGRFRIGRRFYPWLYTVALNHLRAFRARDRRRGRATILPFEDRVSAEDVGREADGPEVAAEQREGEALVQAALARLPPGYRIMIILRQIDGLSVAEVADILDMPEGTVKTRLHRARRLLAAELSGVVDGGGGGRRLLGSSDETDACKDGI